MKLLKDAEFESLQQRATLSDELLNTIHQADENFDVENATAESVATYLVSQGGDHSEELEQANSTIAELQANATNNEQALAEQRSQNAELRATLVERDNRIIELEADPATDPVTKTPKIPAAEKATLDAVVDFANKSTDMLETIEQVRTIL